MLIDLRIRYTRKEKLFWQSQIDCLLCTVYLSVSGTPTFREGGESWDDTEEKLQDNHARRQRDD